MTSLGADLRHGLRIASTELRRSVRGYVGQRRALVGLAVLVVLGGGVLVSTLPGVHSLGQTVRTDGEFPLLEGLRQQMTVLVLGLVVLFAMRTVERIAHVDGEELMLTTTSPRSIVFGILLAEVTRVVALLGPPALLVLGAFVLGAGSPLLGVSALLALLPVLAFAAVFGYLLGIGALVASRYVPLSSSLKTVGYPLFLLVAIVGSQVLSRWYVEDGGSIPGAALVGDALSASPLAAYGDVFLLGSPAGEPVSATGLAVLVGFVAAVPVGLTATASVASSFWTTEAPRSGGGSSSSETVPASPTTVPRPFRATKATRIGWHYLRSGVRAPRQFAHLLFLAFMLAPAGSTLLESPEFVYLFAVGASVLFGAVLAGSAFALNPLGQDRSVLSLLFLTATPPRRFVQGRLVAGLTVGLPLAVGGPVVAALLGPPTLLDALGFAAVGATLTATSATVAMALGTAFPRFESRNMYGVETVTPSTIALLVHNMGTLVTGVVALVVTGIALGEGFGAGTLVLGALGVTVVVVLAVGAGSYYYAVRRFRGYTVE